jgi:dienelactone hydrolase
VSNPFDLRNHVERLYADRSAELAVRAQSRDEFASWRPRTLARLRQLLGLGDFQPPADVPSRELASRTRDGYTETEYALQAEADVEIPVYVLRPDTPGPHPGVMVFHGHNPSVQQVLGNFESPEQQRESLARQGNYAQQLAREGFCVCAVEQQGFGRRQSDRLGEWCSCRHLSFAYQLLGQTMVGRRVRDGMIAISFFRCLNLARPDTLGCAGNSGGGTTTLWLSLLDERITCILPSCYFCSFKASILDLSHCYCNYIPGILAVGEMGDFAAALAPRPVRFIAGKDDPIFPVRAAREQFETVRRAYDLLDASDRCSLTIHDGAHRFDHELARRWFDKWL